MTDLSHRCDNGTAALGICESLLLASDEVANQFAVVGESTGLHLGADPGVLRIGHGDGLADGCHGGRL